MDKLLTIINGTLTKLALLLDSQKKESQRQHTELTGSIDRLSGELQKQKPPVVNVEAPVVNVPEVKVPDIAAPVVNVTVPEIKLPAITVPKPEVTVNVPEIKLPKQPAPVVNIPAPIVNVDIPKEMEVTGFAAFAKAILAALNSLKYSIFDEVDRQSPVPVLLVKQDGSLMENFGGGGGSTVMAGGSSLSGFVLPVYDYASLAQASTVDTWTLKSAGKTVATLTITYTDSTKATIANVAKT